MIHTTARENTQILKPANNFATFYGTRSFVIVFTRAHHLFISSAGSILSVIPFYLLKTHFNIIFPTPPKSSKWPLAFRFLHQSPVSTSPSLQACPTHRLGYIYPEDEGTTALRNVRNWHCHIPGDLTSETRDCTWFTLSTVCSVTESFCERRGKKVFAQTEKQTYTINFICRSRFYIRKTVYFLHVNHSCETERNTASYFCRYSRWETCMLSSSDVIPSTNVYTLWIFIPSQKPYLHTSKTKSSTLSCVWCPLYRRWSIEPL